MIPQYITSDQAKTLLQAAQQQGIDPASALKSLTDNGHIVQGFNDSQYNNDQIAQQTPFGQNLAGENQPAAAPDNQALDYGDDKGFMGDFTAPLRGAAKGLLGFGAGVAKVAGKVFGSQRLQDAADNLSQNQLQNTDTGFEGALQTGGQVIGGALPYVAAGALTGGAADALGGAAATGAESLGAGSTLSGLANVAGQGVVGAATQGATAYLGSGGNKQAAELGAVGGAVAPALSEYVLSPAIKSLSGLGGNGGAEATVNSAKDIINKASTVPDSIGRDLSSEAKGITDSNSDLKLNTNGARDPQTGAYIKPDLDASTVQQLGDYIPANTMNKISDQGYMTPSDVQNISSYLNKNYYGNTDAALLNQNLRSTAQQVFDGIQPGDDVTPGAGTQLENSYAKASDRFESYKTFAKTLGLNSNPSEADAESLISKIKTLSGSPEGKVILKQTLGDFAETEGLDFTDQAKTISYVNKLKPASKAILKALLKGGVHIGEGLVGFDVAKHLGL